LPTGSTVVVQVAVLVPAVTTVKVEAEQPVAELHETVPVTVGLTAPARTAPLGAVTVAVKVTAWPHTDGFVLDATAVVVLPAPTVCVSVPVLVVKSLSPE
jgi:hypothetical protein